MGVAVIYGMKLKTHQSALITILKVVR